MIVRCLLLAAALLLAAPAYAFLEPQAPVVEFYNVYLGHYFMTADLDEIQGVESGKAGPGWERTGYTFGACMSQAFCLDSAAAVRRFYGTPGLGPNSHFYTADAAEAAGLDRAGTGWTFEKVAFYVNLPDAAGTCPGLSKPVYRLYNNRWMFNDSNHRYVTSQAERARMIAKGWSDEGVRWCSDFVGDGPIKSFAVERPSYEGYVRTGAECGDETLNLGPCISVSNLPLPAAAVVTAFVSTQSFFERTGMTGDLVYVVDASASTAASAQNVFLQQEPDTVGIHVDTRDKGPGNLSSVDPLYQLRTTVTPGAQDLRLFPFGPHESEVQLAVSFTLNVKTIAVRSAGGAAYGHPTLELVDRRSGHHLYFIVLTYGTLPIGDYLAPDTESAKVIVGTTFRAASPYGRSLGLDTLPTPSGFQSPNSWGWGGRFEFRTDRDEFQRVLDSARKVDAALSPDPADYFLDNFHFNNEVAGDGEIGVNLAGFRLDLLRR